jgi:F-type H+-transporting ATPase subunit a
VRINWNGKRRWIALLLVIISIILMLTLPPVIPVIQLPGEVWPGRSILGLPITNTLFGSFIVWILIGLLVYYVSRAMPKSGSEVPRGGFYNFFEMAYEGLYGFLEGIAGGRYMRTIFSFFMTIFIIVLLSNWLELIPGVDSAGFLEPHVEVNEETGATEFLEGYEAIQSGPFYYLNPKCPWVSPEAAAALTAEEQTARAQTGCVTGTGAPLPVVEHEAEAETEGAVTAETAAEGETTTAPEGEAAEGEAAAESAAASEAEHHYAPGDPSVPWVVLPYIRVPSTDLNMTLALALIAFVAIQGLGIRALGVGGYLSKFLPIKSLITKPTGVMDVGIGLLEMIGEFAKILSFSFRLLGNIFAGSILLFVISFLVPAVIPWALFLFEFGVGILQALIFALLTAIFMNSATIGHHDEAHEEHEAAH